MNIDRFWLGFITGVLLSVFIIELCNWADRHLIFVR